MELRDRMRQRKSSHPPPYPQAKTKERANQTAANTPNSDTHSFSENTPSSFN